MQIKAIRICKWRHKNKFKNWSQAKIREKIRQKKIRKAFKKTDKAMLSPKLTSKKSKTKRACKMELSKNRG